jgi:SAM-dependent methyltransferase
MTDTPAEPVYVGGHYGLEVRHENGVIVKRATFDGVREVDGHLWENKKAIANEARMLKRLAGTGIAPELIEEHEDYIVEEYIEAAPCEDGEQFRRNIARLLWTLRCLEIHHGDMVRQNMVVRTNSVPIALDWHGAHFFNEPCLPTRIVPDIHLLLPWAATVPSEMHLAPDYPRVIRRWHAVCGSLYTAPSGGLIGNIHQGLTDRTLLDLGCFQGDFCALAAAEGMHATGVDGGGFRTGEDSIQIARALWAGQSGRMAFKKMDIMDVDDFRYDAVLLFSTWPYIVQTHGRAAALDLLKRIMQQLSRKRPNPGKLFFETQLYGDGPGPDFLRTEDDIQAMLATVGTPKALVRTHVTNRPAHRTVWEVT